MKKPSPFVYFTAESFWSSKYSHSNKKENKVPPKVMRIKYFSKNETMSRCKQGEENCLQFLQFLPNPAVNSCIEQESSITNVPSQNFITQI